MTTDITHTLRHLAGHLHHLETQLHDQPLHAARYSQTDSQKSHGGPKPPTNLNNLDYLQDIAPIIKGWCYNLAADTPAAGLPLNQPLATWAAWLKRNVEYLATVAWTDDCTEELAELETQLRHHIHPQNPHTIKLPDYATAEEIGKALDKTPDAVRKWCTRHGVTKYILQGKCHYQTSDLDK